MLRRFWMLVLVVLLAACNSTGPMAGGAPSSATKAAAEQYVTAYNKADGQTIMNLLAEGVTLKPLGGSVPITDRAEVQKFIYFDFPYGLQLNVEKWTEQGDQVSADVMVTSTKKGAFKDTPAQFIWTVKDGKITSVVINPR